MFYFWAQASLYVDTFLNALSVGHSFLCVLFECAIVYRPQISFLVSSLPNRAHILPRYEHFPSPPSILLAGQFFDSEFLHKRKQLPDFLLSLSLWRMQKHRLKGL
ncbi:unnamed protein product [Rangifer tarandus platyrhynchus]|uniref:Uncharacterized protein n=2 Tax=Rangifer tarandus platyrhynchus TaxID=3082113 RepID=A0AC59Z4G7_RANTA|nr:unnamed protein product [Rangifer tarandus platyrhynchus]